MYKVITKKSNGQSAEELLATFINKKRIAGLSDRTINDYEIFIRKYIDYTKPSNLTDFTEAAYIDYVNMLKAKGISSASINAHISALRVFLYDLMREGRIEHYEIKLIKRQESNFKLYTDEELEKLIAKPSRHDSYAQYRTHAIICLILATGARASTVLNMHREDVDFKNKQIAFRHMKTRQALVVPLSDSLSSILQDFMNEWEIESDFLFADVTGNKMSYNALRLGVERYCAKRKVEAKGIHSLRHNFARGWVVNNGNMFQLQRVLGHSTLDMTRKYVRLFAEDLKEDYECYSLLDTISHSSSWKVSRAK